MTGQRVREYSRIWAKAGVVLFILPLVFIGCRRMPPQPTVPPEPQVHRPAQENAPSSKGATLAGAWEYDDGSMVYCLHLNQHGNGKYDWQGGHFVTKQILNGRWQGIWLQTENDREGEFYLRLSENGKKAEGQWWYTRIEEDTSPIQPGGLFVLRHVSGCSARSDTKDVADAFSRAGKFADH